MKHRFGITSRRENWRGVRSIPESVSKRSPVIAVDCRANGRRERRIIWKKLLAQRQFDQYQLIRWAFPS